MSNDEIANIDLTKLIRQRGGVKSRLTNFCKFVDVAKKELTESLLEELRLRIGQMSSLMNEFDNIQVVIEYSCSEIDLANHYLYREEFIYSYSAVMASANLLLKKYVTSDAAYSIAESTNVRETENINALSFNDDNLSISSNDRNVPLRGVKLPVINLPKFNGDYRSWLEFKDTFESLIHVNECINDIQKFHYLRASLLTEPSRVIQSLEFSSDNYKVAWELLCTRYNNSRLLVHNHIKALFELVGLTKESSTGLRSIIDTVSEHLRALETLKQPVSHWDTLIIFLITQKLDKVTLKEWEKGKVDNQFPKLEELNNFLRARADILETLEYKHSNEFRDKTKRVSLVATGNPICNYCKGSHTIYVCNDFLKLSIPERITNIKRLKLCENCLWIGHANSKCKSKPCRICHKKHNSLIHPTRADESSSDFPSATEVSLSSCTFDKHVLLSTVTVEMCAFDGTHHTVRGLLDCGSQSNFITDSLCQKLNLKVLRSDVSIISLNTVASSVTAKCYPQIRSRTSQFKTAISCYVVPTITNNLPFEKVDVSSWKIPENIALADPSFHTPGRIDLLIGASLFWTILSNHIVTLGQGLPQLRSTAFGWIFTGHFTPTKKVSSCYFLRVDELHGDLGAFWDVEENLSPLALGGDDLECENHFAKTTSRTKDGRFMVKIPLKYPRALLGNSYDNAVRRFLSLERKFALNSELRSAYVSFMNEYYELGHMSLSERSNCTTQSYYLPHHGVVRQDSLTTKLRVVFDGSCQSSSGWSLNDLQYVGRTMINDIFLILLRFRQHPIVVTSDVCKMYRQILVHPDDRHLQKIVWRNSPSENLQVFHLNTVTYGTTSAPYLAMRCIQQLAIDNKQSHPFASSVIESDFYVDDLITGFTSEDVALQACQDIVSILNTAKFPLRKWHSNSKSLLNNLQDNNDPNSIIAIGSSNSIKTLGIHWNSCRDVLTYRISVPENSELISKRKILSCIAKIYDPLGLLSPTIILAKIIIQQLWQLKLDWDAGVPKDVESLWLKFYQNLPYLNSLSIQRHILHSEPVEVELHAFCDVSQEAYAACLYVRSVDSSKNIRVNLLCGKTKVAPLKSLTIPRLELCGALLATNLAAKVLGAFKVPMIVHYWTDSEIVLYWLRMSSSTLQQFVSHRVADIQNKTNIDNWHHVRSRDNPADSASRGIYPDVLIKCDIWWHGPHWLTAEKVNWPLSSFSNYSIAEIPEVKKQSFTGLITENDLFPFKVFSTFSKLQRTAAYCLRFIHNCLSVTELNEATKVLVKIAQIQTFFNEIQMLKANLQTKSNLLTLAPFLDDGLIRVGGRLKNSFLHYEAKHPFLLSGKHHLSKLIMEHYYRSLLHAGPQVLLSHTRQYFWPTAGMTLAKKVVRQCIKCFRCYPKSHYVQMADLPRSRVTGAYPFLNTGVDFAGPFLIKNKRGRGATSSKAYICLFICLATRAIHLELATELTTTNFLACLRRFVARRGKPQLLMSDNGTNFVGAFNELKKIYKFIEGAQSEIYDACAMDQIKWQFNPPDSPHFGGIWEANVKSVKRHLFACIGKTTLTYEEFLTILVQIEGILNSRPLYPLSVDPNDPLPLTPFHFLIGRPISYLPEVNLLNIPLNRLNRHQLLQQLQQSFWKRWSKDYLHHLQQRSKWKKSTENLSIGTIVIIKKENSHPYQWPLGVIIETHPGADKVVRVVSVKTASGTLKRAVVKVCPLPLADTEEN